MSSSGIPVRVSQVYCSVVAPVVADARSPAAAYVYVVVAPSTPVIDVSWLAWSYPCVTVPAVGPVSVVAVTRLPRPSWV